MKLANRILKKYFGYDKFRPLQDEVIQSILDGEDALVIMPTGGGKSLCYQIPALMMEGVAIVVSPLIALMKDQVEGLQANGVKAGFLNSSQSTQVQNGIIEDVHEGKIKLLYVSPEKLVSQEFYYLLLELKVNLFAVDEAHCISVWGHDFRPEYSKMAYLKKQFPLVPIVALTATADSLTQKDIVRQLGLGEPKLFLSSFDRPNLSLKVAPGKDKFKSILGFLRQRPHQSGIIYCLSRKACEGLSEKLRNSGVNANYYHAGLSPDERAERQDAFINDDTPIICATIAFGMGIDKSNVRWVIHYNLPRNIESYYQEIGRAGRDGLKADTLLFYSFSDVIVHRKFIEESALKEVSNAKLERIQQFCDAQICRRKILLSYFGEHLEEDCGNCDVCKDPPKQFDGTLIAQKALSAIVRLKEQVSAGTVIDVLRGSSRQEIMSKGYNKVKTYGAGRDVPHQDWQQYMLQLLNLGYISVAYDEGNALKLTEQSKEVLFSGRKVNLVHLASMKSDPKKVVEKTKPEKQVHREDLFEALRKLRLEISRSSRIAPYLVFSDATLHEMVDEKPTSEFEMKMISGVGERKYQLYGELFINEILEFEQKKNQVAKNSSQSFYETYEFYKQGYSVDEIAQIRRINPVTIYSHLASLYEKGADVDILSFLHANDLERTENAVRELGHLNTKELYVHMNEEIPYYKIRLATSYLKMFVEA
ncbi:DNA helicase RecQ [Ancylomarina euxinus]|uniref:DNA helicase RecQ n=1 Tax=Ancylomarina euxinus TaxID=2283627 RepID=A0A425Y5G6_9BACT|nr:DNA helicase RecQ [Ancylomarina euxinus]MCZ4694227.1 DNA helicase RecQ [Ancylomarina euxinus]MUP14442.1 DNA helicase RecQ [Ancylomarina euxinus]RRG23746.1 DNA helicase RecQ [Ancylomarina euxinus]